MNKSGKKSGNRAPNPVANRVADRVEDRRVQKTRKLLSDALASLILEKGYEAVSIQDIIDRANVGRSTFYAHYENKEQLLLFGHEHIRNLTQTESEGRIDFLSFYLHLADKRELALRLMSGGESEEVVTRSLRDILSHSIARLYAPPVEKKAAEELPLGRMRAEAAAAALVQLMTSWLHRGMPYPAAKMAEESTSLLERILAREGERVAKKRE